MEHRYITCLYNRLSANAFTLWAHLPGMPSLRLHLRSCIPRLRAFIHPQPDVIFPTTRVGWLLSIYAVYRVAYTASCRMPSRDRLPTRHALPTVVHTGLRCGRLPCRKPSSRLQGLCGASADISHLPPSTGLRAQEYGIRRRPVSS